MNNPDFIPYEWGIPISLALWALMFFLWWRDRRQINRDLKRIKYDLRSLPKFHVRRNGKLEAINKGQNDDNV